MRISRKAFKTGGSIYNINSLLFLVSLDRAYTTWFIRVVARLSLSLSVDYCLSISVWCRELGQYWSPISKGANFFAHTVKTEAVAVVLVEKSGKGRPWFQLLLCVGWCPPCPPQWASSSTCWRSPNFNLWGFFLKLYRKCSNSLHTGI